MTANEPAVCSSHLGDDTGAAQSPEQLPHFLPHDSHLPRAPVAASRDHEDIAGVLHLLATKPPFGTARRLGAAQHRLAHVERMPGAESRLVERLPEPVPRPHA